MGRYFQTQQCQSISSLWQENVEMCYLFWKLYSLMEFERKLFSFELKRSFSFLFNTSSFERLFLEPEYVLTCALSSAQLATWNIFVLIAWWIMMMIMRLMIMMIKIPSELEVAPRYKMLTLLTFLTLLIFLTLFILFKLLFTA